MKSRWHLDMDVGIVPCEDDSKTVCKYCGNEFKTKALKKKDFEFFYTRNPFCSGLCRKLYKEENEELF